MPGQIQNKHKPVLQAKPQEVRFKLPLNPDLTRALKDSFQEKVYLQQLEKNGKAEFYHLQKTTNEQYAVVDQSGHIIPKEKISPVYAYVILDHGDHLDCSLELRLGKCNHFFLADRGDAVVAAGDIYFDNNTHEIVKFTNQSGGYHFTTEDPRAFPGLSSSMAAMQACGLPMAKFDPVVHPKTLLFSGGLNSSKPLFAFNTDHQSEVSTSALSTDADDSFTSTAQEKMRELLMR